MENDIKIRFEIRLCTHFVFLSLCNNCPLVRTYTVFDKFRNDKNSTIFHDTSIPCFRDSKITQ